MSSTDNETKLRRATEKLIRSIRLAIQEATPNEALAVWKLMKSLEIRRNTPNLTDAQVEALLTMLAKESGADVIESELHSNSSITLTSSATQLEEGAVASSNNNRKGNSR